MKAKLMRSGEAGTRVFALVFSTDDEVIAGLAAFAKDNSVFSANFTGIGALKSAIVAWFDPAAQNYKHTGVQEQVEVTSLIGNFARHQGEPAVHAHITVAKSDGSALGGHLIEAYVRPTLEVFVYEMPATLERVTDEVTGLPLINLDL